MNKLIKTTVAALAALTMFATVGCGSSTSTGGVYLTHSELANEFVARLNLDLGYDVDLVKTNTLQYNYVVVYDYDLGTYDAYDLTGYNPGENMSSFLSFNSSWFYYDVDYVGGGIYEDYWTGVQFSKVTMSKRDKLKSQALTDQIKINKAQNVLTLQYGFSPERSSQIARTALQLSLADKSTMTEKDYDEVFSSVLGMSYSTLKGHINSAAAGDNTGIEAAYAQIADHNLNSSENIKELVKGMFGQTL